MFERPLVTALSALAVAGCSESAATTQPVTAKSAAESRLAAATDWSWSTLSGEVRSLAPTSFQLDHGTGQVLVEMDDWDRFQETLALKPGDRVTVAGFVDRDFLEAKKIEAGTVYVQNLGTHFFANSQDEEDLALTRVELPRTMTLPAATGLVSSVEGREFVLGSGMAAPVCSPRSRTSCAGTETGTPDNSAAASPPSRIGNRASRTESGTTRSGLCALIATVSRPGPIRGVTWTRRLTWLATREEA